MALPTLTDATRQYHTILATTAADVMPEIVNNALNNHIITSLFCGRLNETMFGQGPLSGRAKRMKTGESIEVRVQLEANTTARAMASGYEQFSQDVQDTARVLRANWKLYGATAIISGEERRNNGGEAKIVDLLTYKLTEAGQAIVDLVAQDLFVGDGVTEVTGLDSVITANDSAFQLIGGASYANWNSRGVSAKGTAAASISFAGGSFAATGVDNWILAYMNASEGQIQPHCLVTTEDIYRFYEGSIAPEIRYTPRTTGDATFSALTFKGKPVYHDSYATSGVTYFLNFDHLYLAVSPGADFEMTPVADQQFQDVWSSKVLFQGNLVCDARKFQNKVTGQTA